MRIALSFIVGFCVLSLVTGCEQDKPPQTTRLQTDDFTYVTAEVNQKLASSDFLKDRNSQSTPIAITCRKAENLSMDLLQEPELWMLVLKIQGEINQTPTARAKNIVFQIPPERLAMVRKKFPEAMSGENPTTHTMTCSIKSASRVTNDKEGYVDDEARLYYFDYTITRLSDGKLEWNGSAEFKRVAKGRKND